MWVIIMNTEREEEYHHGCGGDDTSLLHAAIHHHQPSSRRRSFSSLTLLINPFHEISQSAKQAGRIAGRTLRVFGGAMYRSNERMRSRFLELGYMSSFCSEIWLGWWSNINMLRRTKNPITDMMKEIITVTTIHKHYYRNHQTEHTLD